MQRSPNDTSEKYTISGEEYMLFNSFDYLMFFPIVVIVSFIIPSKIRYVWLLIASYYFYMSWNAVYGLLIASCTIVTFLCGLSIDWIRNRAWAEKKQQFCKTAVLTISLIINFGLLFYFKYTNFALHTVQRILNTIGVQASFPTFDILLPVGISFFTFQAVGYTIDVYRGETSAEKNPLRYALFVAFFPQLVAGPIERSKNLLRQLRQPVTFNVPRAKSGLLTMAYGLFLKLVVADNIAIVVDGVYGATGEHTGTELLVATVLFAFQIYCDFDGYTKIAIGSAEVLGYKIINNFDSPYCANSVKAFWRRWHMSLTTWFTDYLYTPLGGSKKGFIRKQINTIVVFLFSGLWHGAAWHFVAWGGINGLLSIAEDVFQPAYGRLTKSLSINTKTTSYKILQRAYTFIAVDFTWLFFRAPSLRTGLQMLKRMVVEIRPAWLLNMDVVSMFPSPRVFVIICFSILTLLFFDTLKYKGVDVKQGIFKQQVVFRWVLYLTLLMVLLFWGVYGKDYEQTQFIYFQF